MRTEGAGGAWFKVAGLRTVSPSCPLGPGESPLPRGVQPAEWVSSGQLETSVSPDLAKESRKGGLGKLEGESNLAPEAIQAIEPSPLPLAIVWCPMAFHRRGIRISWSSGRKSDSTQTPSPPHRQPPTGMGQVREESPRV